jgi:pilus assembly protein Flp/PilA
MEGGVDAIRTILRRLRRNNRGATAIEYGLIVALIGVAIMGALSNLGGGVGGMWGKLNNTVQTNM